MSRQRFLPWAVLCVVPVLAFSAAAVRAEPVLVDGRDRVELSDFAMLLDPDRSLSIGDLRGGPDAARFASAPGCRRITASASPQTPCGCAPASMSVHNRRDGAF